MFRGRHIMLQKLNIMFFRVALKSVFFVIQMLDIGKSWKIVTVSRKKC